jgi:hypothetical protein
MSISKGKTRAKNEVIQYFFSASGGQGALFEKTAPWTPTKTFYY